MTQSPVRFLYSGRNAYALGALAVLALVAVVYWPVLSAGFVWDDLLNFKQRAWLYHGDEWKQYVFTGFNDWQYYFRPLGVLGFVLQARTFGGEAGPMHAVTLAMQLVNVALIMLLARRLVPSDMPGRIWLVLLAGLVFGLHPMLVETVVWIGCQFDQLQVMFATLGLLASLAIRQVWPRAIVVAACFFFSACSKESAAAFPAIVVLFDLLMRSDPQAPVVARLTRLLRENWPVYAVLLLAGIAYLLLRRSVMGAVVDGVTPGMFIPDLARVDEIAYVYLKYWKVILGVPTELNPMHPVGSVEFGMSPILMVGRILASAAIVVFGLWVVFRRLPFTGTLILAATLYLLPVVGIFPGHFDGSLYHERYAIGAVALAAILLPGMVREWLPYLRRFPLLPKFLAALAIVWLAWAVPNVRATIPLWSDDLALWHWAASAHPTNPLALSNLISARINNNQPAEARALVEHALAQDMDCSNCYINGFMMAVVHGDRALAMKTLVRVRDSKELAYEKTLAQLYWRTVGFFEMRLGNPDNAVQALRMAAGIEESEAFTRMLLTEALVASGELAAAQEQARWAVELAWPPERREAQNTVDRILAGEKVYGKPMPPALESAAGDSADE